VLRIFLDEAEAGGATLMLSGEAGTGKTVMLAAAAAAAAAAGVRVLRAVGAGFETNLSFSGLHQIILPLSSDIGRLNPVYQTALNVALGFDAGPAPDQLNISNAAMAMLHLVASARPLLVIVDDLQWLDPASVAALVFAAQRGVPRVGFLFAIRPGQSGPIEPSSVPTLVLQPISDEAAASILDSRFPTLAARVRQRLIAEAQGNLLALMELAGALNPSQLAAIEALPSTLPLSPRLQALFEEGIACLPSQTRRVLLLAALDGVGDLRVLEAAAHTSQLLEDFSPAERGRLVFVDDVNQRVTFRHPLIRSSVVKLSTGGERREAHRALASALLDQPDRHVWHLAEATFDPDESIAAMLDQMGYRMRNRGDLGGAATTSTRAAALTPKGADRARRLAFAAYHRARSGESETGSQLLASARQTDPQFTGSLRNAVVAAVLLLSGDGDIVTIHQLLLDGFRSHPTPWDAQDKVVSEALHTLARVCWFGGNTELWKAFRDVVSRLIRPVPASILLRLAMLADPARATAASLARLERALVGLRKETDPTTIVQISGSARYVDRQNIQRGSLQRIVQESEGSGVIEICALRDLAFDFFLAGKWDESARLANEGLTIVVKQQHRLREFDFRYVLALLAAVRGDNDSNRAHCDELTNLAVVRGALTVEYGSLRARALAAIGRGDFEQAYRCAVAVSPPGKFASHVGEALFVCMDLVEAAVRTDRAEQANAHVAAMRTEGIATLSPRLALVVAGSTAIAARGDVATELYKKALNIPGTDRWPFDLARVRLGYGEHLRRTRSRSRSRIQLSAALDIFQRLGARPWATRASKELRATGKVALSRGRPETVLTPQELEITNLAALGLSNKQIAAQLHLSHHTIKNHLHRAFPKLGITSRAGLRDAIDRRGVD
jgi:DNA-binding CsgD family transcriptional regulator